MSDKPKQLTMKQENFCREYLLTGNASEAYRRAYNCGKSKPETIWKRSSELLKKGAVKGRIDELKQNVEELTGITKAKMLGTLQEVIARSLQKVPVMVYDPIQKEMVQKLDESTGMGIWEYDSSGVNRAVDLIMKAMGYNAPEKKDITSNGETIIIDDKDKDIALKVLKDSD